MNAYNTPVKKYSANLLNFAAKILCLFVLLWASHVRAVLSYWDPQGAWGSYATYTLGALDGTWENMSWSRNATGGSGAPADQGQATPIAFTEGDAACFAVGAGATNSGVGASTTTFTVTMNANHNIAGVFDGPLNPDSCIVTINGTGQWGLANGQGFSTANSSDGSIGQVVINVPIVDASFASATTGQIVAESSGQIFLNAANTYSGGSFGIGAGGTLLGYSGSPWSGIINFNSSQSFGTGNIALRRGYSAAFGALVAEGTSAITIPNKLDFSQALSNTPYLNIVGNPAGVTFSGPVDLGTKAMNLGSGGAANIVIFSGVISNTGSLTKFNPGTLQLKGANTYSGATTVSAGTVQLGVANGIPSGTGKGSLAVNTGASFDMNGFSCSINGLNNGAGGGGNVSSSTGSGTFTLTLGNGNAAGTFGGVIQDLGSAVLAVTKAGTGTQIFDNTNAYTGTTTISAGTLQIGNNDANGMLGPTTVVDNGTLAFKRTDNITIANGISGTGGLTQAGSGTLILNPSKTYTGLTTISAGTLQLAAVDNIAAASPVKVLAAGTFDLNNLSPTNAALSGAGNVINDSGSLTLNGNSITTGLNYTYGCFSGVLSGSGNLVKDGTHSMALRGVNTFSGGAVNILNGTLSVGAQPNTMPVNSAVSISSGGTFQLDANSQTIASLSGAGSVNLGGGVLTVNQSSNTTFSGVIQNSSLAGSSTSTGNGLRGYYYDNEDMTNLKAVRDDANVNFTSFTVTNAVTGLPNAGIATNTFSVRWLGRVVSTVAGQYVFGTTCDDGSRLWVGGSLLIDNWVDQGATAKYALVSLLAGTPYDIVMEYYQNGVGASAVLNWSVPGSGVTNPIPNSNLLLPAAGTLVKNGAGTLALSGVNTYTGPTSVAGGTLDVQSAHGLASGTVTVGSGATLQLDSTTALYGRTTLILNPGTPVVNLNFSGQLIVYALSLDGGSTFQPNGTYGSPTSSASNHETQFTGNGIINVIPCSATNAILGIVNTGAGAPPYTINGLGSPQAQYYLVSQTNATQPIANWKTVPGSTNTAGVNGLYTATATNALPAYYRSAAVLPCP
ncbi:MAG: hypothetical protein C5B50_13290 [Verrucomicrobia bacterium]|nr:MAG: hypothetical protein C5B50_13290 [Verrucomicrobiota bacterium]